VIGATRSTVGFMFRPFRINAGEGFSKYATDDQGKKDHRSDQEQSGNNLFSQSSPESSSRSARLTARVEFGGPQFVLWGVGHGKRTAYNSCAYCR